MAGIDLKDRVKNLVNSDRLLVDPTGKTHEVVVPKGPEPTPPSALQIQEGGDHYKSMAIQPVEFIQANNIPFIEGSVIKYVSRHRNKNGAADIKKAIHFLNLLLELDYGA